MTLLAQVAERAKRRVARVRERYEPVDHSFRTLERYLGEFGGRLAAATAYYGFFAILALAVLAYAVVGFLLTYSVDLRSTVDAFLQENIPVVSVERIEQGSGAASVLGLIGLILAGVAWVDTLRSSQRKLWRLDQAPGNIVLRRALDVVVLLVLAIVLIGSFAVAAGIQHVVEQLPTGSWLARPVSSLLTIAIYLVLAVGLLSVLPRLRISPRRLLPPAVVVAVGLLALNTLGRLYIGMVQANPAYAVASVAAGLLVFLYVFHQLLFLAATWAATARFGQVMDLAFGSESARRRQSESEQPPKADS